MAKSTAITKIVRQLIEAEEKYGGADRLHAYRDAVTDILHAYYKDKDIPKTEKQTMMEMLQSSHDEVMTELYEAENNRVYKIPKKDLPLYISHTWDFDSSRLFFNDRIRKELEDHAPIQCKRTE